MRATADRVGTFEKVGECLYRYTTNGKYYARIQVNCKEVRRSLGTTDRPTARRKLSDLQRDLEKTGAGGERLTLGQLCDRYLATVKNQSAKTVKRKTAIAATIKRDWPAGPDVQIAKVLPSQVSAWLASYGFGSASYNLYLEFIRAAFALAVKDRLLPRSPVEGIKTKKRERPIRRTPSFEDFRAIVASIRGQQFADTAKDSGDFVEFIGLAGLGQAEAGALTWADVDFDTEQITTFRKKTSRGFAVPIYPQVRPLLESIRAARGGSPDGSEKIFRVKDAKKAIANACVRLRLPAYTHRSFRRLFITRAIERGVDVKVIAEWQGHRDGGKLILDTYSHVAPKHSARMAKLMSEENA